MSVLQELEGLKKNCTSRRETSFHAKFQAQCLHGVPVLTLYHNVLAELIIIIFSRSKRGNGEIICLCTRSEENLTSTATVIELHFFMKKKMMKMKNNHVYLYFTPHVHFHPIFCMQLHFTLVYRATPSLPARARVNCAHGKEGGERV